MARRQGSDTLFQAGFDELVEVAVEHALRVATFDVGAQILDARLVEHVGADLVPLADVGLGVFHGLFLLVAFAQFKLIQF